jgi:hypothetical protein
MNVGVEFVIGVQVRVRGVQFRVRTRLCAHANFVILLLFAAQRLRREVFERRIAERHLFSGLTEPTHAFGSLHPPGREIDQPETFILNHRCELARRKAATVKTEDARMVIADDCDRSAEWLRKVAAWPGKTRLDL